MSYKVETVIKHAASTIGEGPHWDDVTQTLLYVDINVGDVHRWNPVTGEGKKIHLDGTVGFVIPRDSGGLVVGLNLAVVAVDWDSGSVTPLATIDERSDNRLNDGKCDASGRLWAGTMNTLNPRVEGASHLYSVSGDGAVLKRHADPVTVSNGLAWSGDNRIMFYIDTPTQQVYAYDFDLQNGTLSNRRVAVDFNKVPEFEGHVPRPDGMTIDSEDKLWVACLDGGMVSQFDPRTGKLLRRVELPNATLITSVSWGGQNHDELYVTSLKRPIFSKEQLASTESLAGSVYRVTGLGAKGKPAYNFHG